MDANALREELGNPSEKDISQVLLSRILREEGDFYAAAYRVASILSRTFTIQGNFQVSRYREDNLEKAKFYAQLAEEFKSKMYLGALPIVGGISKSGKKIESRDPDRIPPDFWKGMMEDHWT